MRPDSFLVRVLILDRLMLPAPLLVRFVVQGLLEQTALLETILCGGCWLPARGADAYPIESQLCPLCGLEPGTPMQRMWRCPCLRSLYFPEVDATRKYVDRVLVEPELECF